MNDLDNVIVEILDGEKYIDYSDASEEQMYAVEEVLNEATSRRPHDNMTFSEHMLKYIDKGYCFLGYDEGIFCSWNKNNTDKKPYSISISDFLKLAGRDVSNSDVSESEFDSVF